MKLYDRFKGLLRSAFSTSTEEKSQPMPENVMMPIAWPNYVSRHVNIKTNETMDTQICAAKWTAVSEIMRSTLDPDNMNREHREFIAHLNALRGRIEISNEDSFPVPTQSLMAVYERRHIFDEISQILSRRVTDLTNVVLLRGADIPTATQDAATVSQFKDKYIEMMEKAMLPYLQPGWTKETSNKAPENKGTAPWGGSGRRPF